jgi:poly-gamma-glutamate synthesis protein (capsule biosynthesis protein)
MLVLLGFGAVGVFSGIAISKIILKPVGQSLSQKSQYAPTKTAVPQNSQEITLIATGDIMLGRTVTRTALDEKTDSRYPFLHVASVLQNADIVFSNLENPVVNNCPRTNEGFKFCAPKDMLEGLTYAGIDIVNLANNHTRNYGSKGMEETKQFLNEKNIQYVGDGNAVVKEIQKTRLGFLGFDFVTKSPSSSDWELVKKIDKDVDILVIGVHWGTEYHATANKNQQNWARMFVENGADVVFGHHPHWVQNDEEVEGVPVFYSLGNFVFDQMWSEETKKGLAVRLTIKDKKIIKSDRLPIYMKEWAQPEWVNSEE